MEVKRIVVIGGGIGGLAAALALQRRRFRVAVYERAPEIREIGAGLIVTSNARRALNDLGVDEALEAASSCVPLMHTCDYATGAIVRVGQNEQIVRQYGMATLQVHRADLHGLLMEAVRGKRSGSVAARVTNLSDSNRTKPGYQSHSQMGRLIARTC